MKARWWALWAAVCILTVLPARADVRIEEPAAGATLRAGSLVEVRWTGVPTKCGELEVLLLLAESARVPVRLTAELDGGTRSFSWRVPNLPSAAARLVVRFEGNGREIEAEPGPPFTIVGDAARPVESVRLHRGELWLGHGPGGSAIPEEALEEEREPSVGTASAFQPGLASGREECGAPPTGRTRARGEKATLPLAGSTFPSEPGSVGTYPLRR